jgi:hypothetical protein
MDATNAMNLVVDEEQPRSVGQRDLASRHLHGVSSLYAVRADLRGVHAFADVVEESVRWAV